MKNKTTAIQALRYLVSTYHPDPDVVAMYGAGAELETTRREAMEIALDVLAEYDARGRQA